jgi:hypothetical protein
MENKTHISEELVKNVLSSILNEEVSKVKRDDFSRVQYKINKYQKWQIKIKNYYKIIYTAIIL